MRERMIFRVGFVALFVLILLFGIGGAAQQSAWNQGYLTGLIAGGGEGSTLSQYLLVNRHYSPFLAGFGFLFKFAFFAFLFFAAMKFFRMMAWRAAGQPGGKHWGHHWHWHSDEEKTETDNQKTTPKDDLDGVKGL